MIYLEETNIFQPTIYKKKSACIESGIKIRVYALQPDYFLLINGNHLK